MEQERLKEVLKKFVEDPDWIVIEDLIQEYVALLHNIDGIDTSQDSDTVRAEVVGRKTASKTLEKFLTDMRLVKQIKSKSKHTFR
jgi:hypothetical protein